MRYWFSTCGWPMGQDFDFHYDETGEFRPWWRDVDEGDNQMYRWRLEQDG